MKLLTIIIAVILALPQQQNSKENFWDALLNKYEELCIA